MYLSRSTVVTLDYIGGEVLVVLGALDDQVEVEQADERAVGLGNICLSCSNHCWIYQVARSFSELTISC